MCIVGITRTLMLNFKIHKTSADLGRITITSNINSLTRAIVISVLNISFKSLFQKVKLRPVGLQPCRGFSFFSGQYGHCSRECRYRYIPSLNKRIHRFQLCRVQTLDMYMLIFTEGLNSRFLNL